MSVKSSTSASGSPEQGPYVIITPEHLAAAVRDGLTLHAQEQQEAYQRALQERANRSQQPGQPKEDPTNHPDYIDPMEQAKANADLLRRSEVEKKASDLPVRFLARLGLSGLASTKAYGSAAPAHKISREKGKEHRKKK